MAPLLLDHVEALALELVGTPFEHMGRTPGAGLDCVGVVAAIAAQLGQPIHGIPAYAPMPDGRVLSSELERSLDPEDVIRPGVVIAICIGQCEDPRHVAVVVRHPRRGDECIVHALASRRAVALDQLTDRWRSRIHSAWAFRHVDPDEHSAPPVEAAR